MKRLKVLISAFALSPFCGSERGVGWNIVTRLAKYHDVTVLYGDVASHQPNRNDMERWLAENGSIEGLRFEYVEVGGFGSFFERLSGFRPLVFLHYFAYRCWQHRAYQRATELLALQPYDLAHLLTYVSYREPGYLWKLDVPFFWGPINGADNIPWAYFGGFSLNGKVRYAFRNMINSVQRYGSGTVRRAARMAVKIWAVTDEDCRMVSEHWNVSVERESETGINADTQLATLCSYCPTRSLHMVWSGVLEDRKALPLLLSAMALLKEKRVHLTVLGDGPERGRWRKLADELGLSQLIDWRGRLPLADAQRAMTEADLFVFTSVKEASSTVVMEALACGLPVICHDACGMKHVVNDSCGIRIPLLSPEVSVEKFAEAIRRILESPELVRELSEGALKRGRKFSWDEKVHYLAKSYSDVLSKK